LNQTFNAKNSFYKNNWFARQQSRRNHPMMVLSGILISFEYLFDVLFVVSIVVKIIKNRKATSNSL